MNTAEQSMRFIRDGALVIAIAIFSASMARSQIVNPPGGGGGGGTGCIPAGSSAEVQASNGSGACQDTGLAANAGIVTTGAWHGTIIAPTYGGTGVNNGSFTVTLSGNLIFSGAFNPTFVIPSTGSWTFPAPSTLIGTSGLTNGYIMRASSASAAANSNCDVGITTANTVTCSDTGGIAAKSFTSTSTAAGTIWLPNSATPSANIANTWGWTAPATITTSWFGEAPNASPAANQIMLFPAPTTDAGSKPVSQWAWTTFSFANLTDHAAPSTSTINDANGNPFIASTATASAVDSLTITNAATANPATVVVSATGSDSNININLVSKGTGTVQCNGSSCGGGGSGIDPTNPTQFAVYDDFLGVAQANAYPQPTLGWNPSAIVSGTATYSTVNPIDNNHPGEVVIENTGTHSSGNGAYLQAGSVGSGKGWFLNLKTATNWTGTWIINPETVASGAWYVGMLENAFPTISTTNASNVPNGMYFRFDPGMSTADATNWKCIACAGGTCNTASIDSGVAFTAATWYDFVISSTSAGTVLFKINGTTVATVTTNLPTVGTLVPTFAQVDRGSSLNQLYIDFFSFKATGLTR